MNCIKCHRDMPLIRGNLHYTLLDTMQAMLLVNCEFYNCKRCDTVIYPEETQAYIIQKIKEHRGKEKIIINF